jgi:NhaA family Na+:H+ antiporter
VLPMFAFFAALVVIPQVVVSEVAAPFSGVLVALWVGRLIGVGLGGWLSTIVRAHLLATLDH